MSPSKRRSVATAPIGIRRLLLGAIFLSGILAVVARLNAVDDTVSTVYFYSPETNINNYSLLKAEFDSYLSQYGRYQFQPFSKRSDFERFVSRERQGVFLVSSWHFRKLRDMTPLDPILVASLKEQSTQKRVLSAKKRTRDLARLKGKRIATAGSSTYTKTLLRGMIGEAQAELLDSFKILVVPKDIDALMAVTFGMAKAALTTESSLAKLRRINPKQCALLHQLATSRGSLLPIVAAPEAPSDDLRGLLSVIESMGNRSEGAKRLKMLGFDRLRKLKESERRILLQ